MARRAPFDLDCPAERVTYERLDSRTIGARGCNGQATYVNVCRDKVDNTTTMLTGVVNTDTECQWFLEHVREKKAQDASLEPSSASRRPQVELE